MSVYVKYDQWGRMGNRMFQYAFGYILATQQKCELYHDSIPNFNIPSKQATVIPVNEICTSEYGKNKVDVNSLLCSDRDIIVDSYVQRAEYYIEHRDILQQIFTRSNNIKHKDKLVVHIRETDYTQINAFLGYEYYSKLIKDTSYTDIIIVTDNSKCETVQRLLSEGCVLNSEGYVDKFTHTSDDRGMLDFMTLLESENVALSQSSFSWWAAFLGNHKEILFPYTGAGLWPATPDSDDIDLYFDFGASRKYTL